MFAPARSFIIQPENIINRSFILVCKKKFDCQHNCVYNLNFTGREFFVFLQIMKIEDVYKEKINDLMIGRDCTKFHITGIRHCDFKDEAEDFIKEAAEKMLNVSFFPEKANRYDHEAVSCRHGRKQIGYVTTYDLEKYYILAGKNNTDHLTGHFGHFSANIEDHLLKLYISGSITLDDISEYRNKVKNQKNELYGSWEHDAIDQYLVHSRHQDDAIACISQLKEHVLMLYGGHGTSTREELMPLLQDYKDCSQYDISLEGQQDRWDILLYLDYLHDFSHQPGHLRDDFYESILKDVEDAISQIGGELVRSVSYKSYIERLTELVIIDLPSSEVAQHYLKTLPREAFDDIRQQVQNFPHHLYHLFLKNPEEFVRTLYYARIPRKYLDPFLSGIALLEAYDNIPPKWQMPDEKTMKLRNLGDKLEEWYEDYCERIVQYPIERQLNALRNMREQVLASADWAEGSPRMGNNEEDIRYLIFSTPKENYKPRLRDFGNNFIRNMQGEKRQRAWEEYIPEKIAHEMPLAEFAYMFFCSALNYEIDRLEDVLLYDKSYKESTNPSVATCVRGESINSCSGDNKKEPDPRETILNELLGMVDKGDWAKGVTADDIKQMVRTVLGFGETKLNEDEKEMSDKLWQQFQGGRPGNLGRLRIVWQKWVGFMLSKNLLVEKSAPMINIDFFGNKKGSDNINKGKNQDSPSFRKIVPLLEKYCPQQYKTQP